MSNTHTTRTSVSRPQNTQLKTNSQLTEKSNDAAGSQSTNTPHRPDITERTQRRDAYTVIVPDEEKRRSIQQKAKEEERKMDEYREQHRIRHVNYVGTPGDSGDAAATGMGAVGTSNSAAAGHQVNRSKMSAAQKTRYYREQEKLHQENEDGKKKLEQRRKAAENEERERQRKQKLDDDRKKKNEAFLGQFANSSRQSVVGRQAAAEVASQSGAKQVNDDAATNVAPAATDDTSDSQTLDHLQSMFPDFPRDYLHDLLRESSGDVNLVIEALTAVD